MKKRLDKHGLSLSRVTQSLAYINRARQKFPDDECRLYYDYGLKYVLPADRNTQAAIYEAPGMIFLCARHFTDEVSLQQLYDLVYEHYPLIDEYKSRQAVKSHKYSIVATPEEWDYMLKALDEYRKRHEIAE